MTRILLIISSIIFFLDSVKMCLDNADFLHYCGCVDRPFLQITCKGLDEDSIMRALAPLRTYYVNKLVLDKLQMKYLSREHLEGLVLGDLVIKNSPLEFIEEGAIGSVDNLRELIIEYTQLNKIPDLTNSKLLDILSMVFVRIPDIENEDLSSLKKLRKIIMRNCHLGRIGEKAFYGLNNLKIVDFRYNSIEKLPSTMFDKNTTIANINLGYNLIDRIPKNLSINEGKISAWYLDHNNIQDLPQNYFQTLLKRGTRVSIRDNPIKCDKSLCWLFELEKDVQQKINGNCGEPKDNYGKDIRFITKDEIQC